MMHDLQIAAAYTDYIHNILIFGVLAMILQWMAYSRGLYALPSLPLFGKDVLSLKSVVIFFAIYLIATLLVAPLAIHLIALLYAHLGTTPSLTLLSSVQLFSVGVALFFFYLYARTQNRDLMKRMWKDYSNPHAKPILVDFLMGSLTWLLSFPLVVVVSQIADMLLYFFFGFESYEQVAVHYLKRALLSPQTLLVALFMILMIAPMVEEFLFRGCLQTYFKRYVGVKGAIVLSSLAFAIFHLAVSQGIGNISLCLTLFTFALFLGLIYERQASLFASIGLHMTFNLMSALRIIFLPEM